MTPKSVYRLIISLLEKPKERKVPKCWRWFSIMRETVIHVTSATVRKKSDGKHQPDLFYPGHSIRYFSVACLMMAA